MFWAQKSFIASIYTAVPLTQAVSIWGLARLFPLRGEIDDRNETGFFCAVLLIYNEYPQSYAFLNLAETTRGSFWSQFKNPTPQVPLTLALSGPPHESVSFVHCWLLSVSCVTKMCVLADNDLLPSGPDSQPTHISCAEVHSCLSWPLATAATRYLHRIIES